MQLPTNPKVSILSKNVLVSRHYEYAAYDVSVLHDTYGEVVQTREVLERGSGAAILLVREGTTELLLTRQFRLPSYLNGNSDGHLIEVCAGLIDDDEDPLTCILRETEEEVGIRLNTATKVMEVFASPGVLTEKIYLFIASYTEGMRVSDGGGLDEEQEHIELITMELSDALAGVRDGKITDAKTVLLLQYAQLHLHDLVA